MSTKNSRTAATPSADRSNLLARLRASKGSVVVTADEARYLGRLASAVPAPEPTGRRGRPRLGVRAKIKAFLARAASEADKLTILPGDRAELLRAV